MKTQVTQTIGKVLSALIALIIPLSATGTGLGNNGVGLRITPELTARWWQWVFSIPSSVHPLSQKAIDPTGAAYCMVGQQGGEWFLGGVFKVVDVSPTSNKTQSTGNGIDLVEIERECEIPLGKTILIPVLNAECNTAEELALKNEIPNNLRGKARYLRDCAKTQADAVDKHTVTAYFGPVGSGDIWTQNPVQVRRVRTILPFSITYSPDNILSENCELSPEELEQEPPPSPFLCAPDPNPSLAQVDGYWAHVRFSKPGIYKLQTFGEAPAFDFALRVTYTLTVVAPDGQ